MKALYYALAVAFIVGGWLVLLGIIPPPDVRSLAFVVSVAMGELCLRKTGEAQS